MARADGTPYFFNQSSTGFNPWLQYVPGRWPFKYSVAAGSLAEDPAMVCSYIQMEHNPAHTWHAAQGPFQETLPLVKFSDNLKIVRDNMPFWQYVDQ